jgi:acetolactate decarboxylase
MQLNQIILTAALCLLGLNGFAQEVNVQGAMSNVMRKGELMGTIYLDTLKNKTNLYGLGPKEYLKGELLIIDGAAYCSSVNEDGSIKMDATYDIKAPFFVYANNKNWQEYVLPPSVQNIKQLEAFLDSISQNKKRPFVFLLSGEFAKLNFHIQNLPDGAIVKSPKDAHQGQAKYERVKAGGTIVGFFSTAHQTIFTHHDSYIHMHYINSERTEMGHLDDLILGDNAKIKLLLPAE